MNSGQLQCCGLDSEYSPLWKSLQPADQKPSGMGKNHASAKRHRSPYWSQLRVSCFFLGGGGPGEESEEIPNVKPSIVISISPSTNAFPCDLTAQPSRSLFSHTSSISPLEPRWDRIWSSSASRNSWQNLGLTSNPKWPKLVELGIHENWWYLIQQNQQIFRTC